jgi:hypothetical protein
VLAVGLLLVLGTLALDMSGSASRIAGTDHVQPAAFVATLQGDQLLCQSQMVLPTDASTIQMLVGTYGHPVPEVSARFLGSGLRVIAQGRIAAGAHEGLISIPMTYPHGPAQAGVLCLTVVRAPRMVLAGVPFPPGSDSVQVGASRQPGRIDVVYLRPGSESWWQLLPTLSRRFGFGKAPVFGTWTLPVVALALIGVWFGAFRLLARELV